jgi:ubiquinone/menaquinone biosynthesis C-methylase UbiE
MRQKDVFLESEGDAWYARNASVAHPRAGADPDVLLAEILGLRPAPSRAARVLEIGCGEGARLASLKERLGCECYGIEPSARAVAAASARGVRAEQGTADRLPYGDRSFEIVIFGFCLYLCDREDLFRIASEADRVLRSPGWLLIQDFYSPVPTKREYRHRAGVFSYKMDYRQLFTWHPAYTTYLHRLSHHVHGGYTDQAQEWVAVSVLRKLADGQ